MRSATMFCDGKRIGTLWDYDRHRDKYIYSKTDAVFIEANSKKRFINVDQISAKKNSARVIEITNRDNISEYLLREIKELANVDNLTVKTITTKDIRNRLNDIPVYIEDNKLYAFLKSNMSIVLNPSRTKPYNFDKTLDTWIDNVNYINSFLKKPKTIEYLKFINSFGEQKIEFTALTLNSFRFFKKLVNTFDESKIKVSEKRVTEIINTLVGFLYPVKRSHYGDYVYVPSLFYKHEYIHLYIKKYELDVNFFSNSIGFSYTNGKKLKGKVINVTILGETKKVKITYNTARFLSYLDSMYVYEEALEYFEKQKLLGVFNEY